MQAGEVFQFFLSIGKTYSIYSDGAMAIMVISSITTNVILMSMIIEHDTG